MSSNYSVLCLSHDPAIIVHDPGYNRPEQAEAAIRDGFEGHRDCDLMIGRYSYPLVELGCPASRHQPDGPRPGTLRCYHGGTQWTDKEWLLLLAAAYQSTDPAVREAAKEGYHHCLPWERLRRLRVELGITIAEPDDSDLTEADVDRMMASGVPVQITTVPSSCARCGRPVAVPFVREWVGPASQGAGRVWHPACHDATVAEETPDA